MVPAAYLIWVLPPSQIKSTSRISRSQPILDLTGFVENSINICIFK
jgi:hypothetical protein